MSATLGLVTDTIPFSNVDGPGNRYVVFLQGCNFDCVACHNPYTIGTCNDCGLCVERCPSGALHVDDRGRIAFDVKACAGSNVCIDTCPQDATPKARWRRDTDVLAEIRALAPFLSGVTVSGGEATRQPRFVRALFHAVKTDAVMRRLTCFIDSNGHAEAATWRLLAPVTDGAMIDLKCLDDTIHRQMTGQSNELVLRSLVELERRHLLHEVRLLVVPGLNDAPDIIARTGAWLAALDPDVRVKLIGFRCHGVRPTSLIGREPSRDELEAHAARLADAGLRQLTLV